METGFEQPWMGPEVSLHLPGCFSDHRFSKSRQCGTRARGLLHQCAPERRWGSVHQFSQPNNIDCTPRALAVQALRVFVHQAGSGAERVKGFGCYELQNGLQPFDGSFERRPVGRMSVCWSAPNVSDAPVDWLRSERMVKIGWPLIKVGGEAKTRVQLLLQPLHEVVHCRLAEGEPQHHLTVGTPDDTLTLCGQFPRFSSTANLAPIDTELLNLAHHCAPI